MVSFVCVCVCVCACSFKIAFDFLLPNLLVTGDKVRILQLKRGADGNMYAEVQSIGRFANEFKDYYRLHRARARVCVCVCVCVWLIKIR